MNISQLMETLQGVLDQYGDVFVETDDERLVTGVSCVFQEGVKYDVQAGEFPPVVAVKVHAI